MKTQTPALHQVQRAFNVHFLSFRWWILDGWVWCLHDHFVINVVMISKFCLPTIPLMDSWNFSNWFVDYRNHIPQTVEDDSLCHWMVMCVYEALTFLCHNNSLALTFSISFEEFTRTFTTRRRNGKGFSMGFLCSVSAFIWYFKGTALIKKCFLIFVSQKWSVFVGQH